MCKILGLSLVFCLGLCLTSASVRGGDAEEKAAPPAQVKKPGAIFKAPGSATFDVALSADGKLLARAGINKVDLWDVASGKKLHTLTGHNAPLLRVKFSPDGTTLASITGSWLPNDVLGEVKLWDVATGKERVALKRHPTRGLSLAVSPDGKTLASSAGDVKLWDVDTGKEKLELKLGKDDVVWSLAFSPDGKTLAMGTGGGLMDITPSSVIFWDVTTGKERARTLPAHANSITCVQFASDGKTLASASGTVSKVKPGVIKLWDVATAKERATIPTRIALPLQFLDLAFTADGKTLTSAMWSIDEKKNEAGLAVDHWELATGKARATHWAPFSFASQVAGIFFSALSADGKTVAWGGEEKKPKYMGTAHVWDVESLATTAPKLSEEPKKIDPEGAKKPGEN